MDPDGGPQQRPDFVARHRAGEVEALGVPVSRLVQACGLAAVSTPSATAWMRSPLVMRDQAVHDHRLGAARR